MLITGAMLRDAYISAANNIQNNRRKIDALNVFPVPDGDTGTNMSMTFGAAKRELVLQADSATVSEVAAVAASALLRGARGNSGVILSLLFRGFAKGLQGKTEAGAADFSTALQIGVESAYKAVMKPTEGTILTVARMGAERAQSELEANAAIGPLEMWEEVVKACRESVELTPELLPVLKKAGVVDAGGKGLLLIFEGMFSVFVGEGIIADAQAAEPREPEIERNAAAEHEGEITLTYCTEFIVLKSPEAASNGAALALRAYLESIGDSVVVVEDEEIIKCHVHTDNPGNALQKALASGALASIKIDNMREQHSAQQRAQQQMAAQKQEKTKFDYVQVDAEQTYGFVSVAAGEGIATLFRDLGVNNVVSGGQTMNPSTDDILEAVHATPAKNVIVLPNNKNIIMAAEQAIKLADRNVYVLPTKSIQQGLAAMMVFDGELPLAENQLAMVKATERVGSGLITYAARDSVYDGHKIKKDEILALENNKVAFVEKDAMRAAVKLTRSLLKRDSAFVTVLYGADVTGDEADELQTALRQRLPDSVELAVLSGGQPVYYYMIAVE